MKAAFNPNQIQVWAKTYFDIHELLMLKHVWLKVLPGYKVVGAAYSWLINYVNAAKLLSQHLTHVKLTEART